MRRRCGVRKTDEASPGVRRLCIAVSSVDPAGLAGTIGYRLARTGHSAGALNGARRATSLDRALWDYQPDDDGELALLPPGVDEAQVISQFLGEARDALGQHNRGCGSSHRVRLRIAFHQGITFIADTGYSGPAVRIIRSLLNAQKLSDVLVDHVSAELAIIVSQQIFEDVIPYCPELRPAEFIQVQVMAAGNPSVSAWIRVAG